MSLCDQVSVLRNCLVSGERKVKPFQTHLIYPWLQSQLLSFRHNEEVVKMKYSLMDLDEYNFSTLAKFRALLLQQLLNFPKMWDFT